MLLVGHAQNGIHLPEKLAGPLTLERRFLDCLPDGQEVQVLIAQNPQQCSLKRREAGVEPFLGRVPVELRPVVPPGDSPIRNPVRARRDDMVRHEDEHLAQ